MGSTSTMSANEEEFMEDLITLAPLASDDSDCEIVSVSENKIRPEIKKKPHGDAQNKPQSASSYGKGDFYLPARFFDISRNKSLLLRCRAMSVSIVDCGKFPWYYRKKCGIRKPRPKSKQTYTLQNLLQDLSFEQKLKQQKLDKYASEHKNKSTEVVGKVSLTPSKDPSSVDFKKNKGLVGLKIERKLVGLVFDEKSKEDRKRKSKHTADKIKMKSSDGKESKREKENNISIEKNKASKAQDEPNKVMMDKVDKILLVKETSLKCSLNISPILSPSVQQKLLQMVSKSVQNTRNSSIDNVNLSSRNMYNSNNKSIIGQKVIHIDSNFTKESKGDGITATIDIATPIPKVVSDKNTLISTETANIQNKMVVESDVANIMPEKQDLKIESPPNEVIKPDQVHIKSEPEIKQELKDEVLATEKALNEGRTTSVIQSNTQIASLCSPNSLRSFRRSIENVNTSVSNEDVRESIPAQTAAVSNQNIVNWQWHQYNEADLYANPNYPPNSYPTYKLAIPQTRPNVNNLQVIEQKMVPDTAKPKVGDLKIQTVSQINNSVVTPVSALSEFVHNTPLVNNVQNNELPFHPNSYLAQLPVQGSETNNPVPMNFSAKNAQERKVVQIKNAYFMHNQKRHVPVGPYSGPPYQQFGYQPRMRTSGPAVQWQEHTHLASKMPILTHHLNQRQQPIQSPSYWDPPASNQEYFNRSISSKLNQAYDQYYHSQWNHPQQRPPPTYSVERQQRYVPPYARQKNRPPNYGSPNSKPDERDVSTPHLPENAINQVTSLPAAYPHTPPLQGPQSVQCVKDVNRVPNTPVHTLPTPSAVITSLPTLSPQTLALEPVQEIHTAQILYPNTTFSQESTSSPVIYTEGSNHINPTPHQKQITEHCLTQIKTTEMSQTPIEFPKDKQEQAVRALDMPVIESSETNRRSSTNSANIVLLHQKQAENNTPKKSTPTAAPKPTYRAKKDPIKRLFILSNDTRPAAFDGTVTSVSDRSVPAVLERNVKKGYSPPILPIPTVQKSLEILALVNAIKTPNNEPNNSNRNGGLTPVKQSGYRNNLVNGKPQITPRKVIPPSLFTEKSTEKRKLNDEPQSATKARKISIDEYKKRYDNPKSIDLTDDLRDQKNKELTPTKDKSHKKRFSTNNENRGVDLQDLGYDSDPPKF